MLQILQNLKTGETEIVEVPTPATKTGFLLVETSRSLISPGTERATVEATQASLLDRALKQPQKVATVLQQVAANGLAPTIDSLKSHFDQLIPLGYCNVGRIVAAGPDTGGFAVGDRVVSNGPHAEVVNVAKNLCAKIPDSVSDEEAAFTVLGAIGLQGLRLAAPTLGERFAVFGLGVLGLLTVQLLRSNGCAVLGVDFDPARLKLAREFGAETVDLSQGADPVAAAKLFSKGKGVDGVLITAATDSDELMHQAAQVCRKRGRIILVGVTGLNLKRSDFYEKELTFQVSCSYGPGRHDSAYEEEGKDYPFGFVRWTEQRNFEAILELLADKRLHVAPLISHRFPVADAKPAYQLVGSGADSLGVLLEYPAREKKFARTVAVTPATEAARLAQTAVLGIIGAGNFANTTLLPAFKKTGADLRIVTSRGGVSATHMARRHGIGEASSDLDRVFEDPAINSVVIITRHDSHPHLVCRALERGKNVFVEKPLAIHEEGLRQIESAYAQAQKRDNPPVLMVGFNRRFAPQIAKMKELLAGSVEPKAFVMTVNAGMIPPEHWTQSPALGGGRIIGEGCHFVDLLRYLAGSPIVSAHGEVMGNGPGPKDTVSIQLKFADGSVGTIHYFANGNKALPKERLEVFVGGKNLHLDNFKKLSGLGWRGFQKMNFMAQDKGHLAATQAFVDAVKKGRQSPIPFSELIEVARATFSIQESLT